MNLENQILSDITVYSKYARYLPEKDRRETWEELVERNVQMHINQYPQLEDRIREVYVRSVIPKKILPSMRSLQFGGLPIERNNSRIYNCAYLPMEHIDAFAETMFLLLGGTGVGYSVQYRHVNQLPVVVGPKPSVRRFIIGDSIEGWADAVKMLMESYFLNRMTVNFDFGDIREKGTELVTSGGKAPGPQPLKECLEKVREILENAVGRTLEPIEVHDIQCHLADAVLAGGIRRAAMISLFSKEDDEMLNCKSQQDVELKTLTAEENSGFIADVVYKGNEYSVWLTLNQVEDLRKTGKLPWFHFEPQRSRANNSVALLRGSVDKEEFDDIWERVKASGAGEPGFYWTNNLDWGTNPCCEIALEPYQFCNLTEINAATVENKQDFRQRASDAAFVGTLQAGYTNFHYLRNVWKETTERAALIGVGITGIASNNIDLKWLDEGANTVLHQNQLTANQIGINVAERTTTVKPSGTSSLVVGSSSGIHAYHDDYYLRRMRFGKDEDIYSYLLKKLPELCEDEFFRPDAQGVFTVPQKATEGAAVRSERASKLFQRVMDYNSLWVAAGHRTGDNKNNVSCTFSLKDDEWDILGGGFWGYRDTYNGVSVLPYDGGTYKQAPFESTDKETYDRYVAMLKEIDLTKIKEKEDNTNLAMEAACAGGVCEIP